MELEELRKLALAKHLNLELEINTDDQILYDDQIYDISDIEISSYDDTCLEYYNQEYYVLTDDEANDKEDEYLDNYIDNCLEIPENIRFYFNEELWKKDARMDGRGHSLASYDGEEDEVQIKTYDDNIIFYIYRIN